jgi:hypothetical protein
MATYTAPAIDVPAVPEHTETVTDPGGGPDITVTVPAAQAYVTCVAAVPGSRYALDRASMTFAVTTPAPIDPIPDGWVEV